MKKRLITVLSVILTFLMLGGTFSFAANVSPVKVDQFTDVSAQDWYYDYVDFVSQNAYMIGTSDTTFEPQSNLTRAMFATILARYDKAVVDDSKATIFQDVPVDQWYTGSIGWANENAIVQGYGDGNFGTNDSITRQDLSLMIIRYIRFYEKEHKVKIKTHGGEWQGDITFTDESEIRQDEETPAAIKDLVKYGILLGYPDGTVKPTQKITRAETAAIIKRLDWILSPKPTPTPGPDQTEDYYQVVATLTPPATVTDKKLELMTEEYTEEEAYAKTMDDVIIELITGDNQDAITNAFESALSKVKAQEYKSADGVYSVKIDEAGTITATKNGNPVDLKAELDKEKATYDATMAELKGVAGITSDTEWTNFVDACWVDNLFDFTDTSATLKDADAYYVVLSNAVNAGVTLHQALQDAGYDFAKGVQDVATWAETEKGIKLNGYTVNDGTVTNPTDVLNGTKVIGALNYEEGIVLDVLDGADEHIVLDASETIPGDADALMNLINDRTSMDFSDHDGGFEAILSAIVSNGKLLGEYNVEVKVIKVD